MSGIAKAVNSHQKSNQEALFQKLIFNINNGQCTGLRDVGVGHLLVLHVLHLVMEFKL